MTGRNIDKLTPEFRLRINGNELPPPLKADLISVNVQKNEGGSGTFSFKVFCWDNAQMKVKWLDDELFTEGNAVDIEMGYRGNLKCLFLGEITGLEPQFSGGGAPTLTVSGEDRQHRLMHRPQTRVFQHMKDSDIANQIAADHGLTPDIEDTGVTFDHVSQNNQTDSLFLRERARRIGFEVTMTEQTLRFRSRANTGNGSLTLKRETDLLEFSVRLNVKSQTGQTRVQGWDERNKEGFVADSGAGDEQPMQGTNSATRSARRISETANQTTVNMPVQSQAETDQLAHGQNVENAMDYIQGSGSCIGRTDLMPGLLVNIEGFGSRFSGSYYVTSASHSYSPGSGYRTNFSVRRNTT